MIIQETSINSVREISIESIISDHVVLKKSGAKLIGLCPFHKESSPSFTVYPDSNSYHCFGCKASGDGINFIKELNNISFQDAINLIAERNNITLEIQETQKKDTGKDEREKLYEIAELAAKVFHWNLTQPHGKDGLDYCRERNIESSIESFQLGFATNSWDMMANFLLIKKGYPPHLVEKLGLIKKRNNGGGYFDFLRNRVIVPIRDIQGKVIAFSGRAIAGEQPKYLNTPDSPIFSKKNCLFALDKARQSIRKKEEIIIGEGLLDAVTAHQKGVTNFVAALGTNITEENVKAIAKLTSNIVLALDQDSAGQGAIKKFIETNGDLIYSGQISAKILQFKEKDIDEYLSNHALEEFESIKKKDGIEWLFDLYIQSNKNNSAIGEKKLIENIAKSLAKFEDILLRDYYCRYVATIYDKVSLPLLLDVVKKARTEKKYFQKRLEDKKDVCDVTYYLKKYKETGEPQYLEKIREWVDTNEKDLEFLRKVRGKT